MQLFSLRNVVVFCLVVLIAIVLILSFNGIVNFSEAAQADQLVTAKNLIERAVIQCYALEGSYPPTLDYLKNYGIVPNYDKFYYSYEVIGANVMPVVEVRYKQ